jgi:hypothetical protein
MCFSNKTFHTHGYYDARVMRWSTKAKEASIAFTMKLFQCLQLLCCDAMCALVVWLIGCLIDLYLVITMKKRVGMFPGPEQTISLVHRKVTNSVRIWSSFQARRATELAVYRTKWLCNKNAIHPWYK